MDKYRLEYEIKSRGKTVSQLCQDLHISRSAYHRKVNGQSVFTITEIQAIIDYLGLDTPMGIFFTDKVSQRTQGE